MEYLSAKNPFFIDANLTSYLKRLVPEMHLLMVLFGTNLLRNIGNKAQKSTIFNAQFGAYTRCKSNALLGQGFLLKIRRKKCFTTFEEVSKRKNLITIKTLFQFLFPQKI